jgi:alcohol dehydrogenase
MLLEIVQSGTDRSERLITHRFRSDQILDAYEIFGQAARTRALRVLIEA